MTIRARISCEDCGRLGPEIELNQQGYANDYWATGNAEGAPWSAWVVEHTVETSIGSTYKSHETVCPRCQRERRRGA